MSEKLKLSLTLQALEKLCGGDSQVEVELRQGVAAEFAKRHLKGIINDEVTARVQALKNLVTKILQQELEARGVTVVNSVNYPRVQLSEQVKDGIRKQVDDAVTAQVKELVLEALAATDLKSMVNANVAALARAEALRKARDAVAML